MSKKKGGLLNDTQIMSKSEHDKLQKNVPNDMKYQCGFSRLYNERYNTCFLKNDLVKISKKYNITNAENMNIQELIDKINEKTNCNGNQICFMKNHPELKKQVFKPIIPQRINGVPGEFPWLSNFDIEAVMKQIELGNKSFIWGGVIGRDFEVYPNRFHSEIQRLASKDKQNITTPLIMSIVNTDKFIGGRGGEHWFAVIINNRNKTLYRFDSYGEKSRNISEIKQVANQLNYKYIQNINQLQYGTSECGMFSLYFVIDYLKKWNRNYIKYKHSKSLGGKQNISHILNEFNNKQNLLFNKTIETLQTYKNKENKPIDRLMVLYRYVLFRKKTKYDNNEN